MSKNRTQFVLEELKALKFDGVKINRKIVRSRDTQDWIDRLYAMGNLNRNDRDHTDYLICLMSEHSLRDWPSGKRLFATEVVSLLTKIHCALQVVGGTKLSPIIDYLVTNDDDLRKLTAKEKRGLRMKSIRYYERASKGRLDLAPTQRAAMKRVVRGLSELMKTRRKNPAASKHSLRAPSR